MSQGIKILEEERQSSLENERKVMHFMLEHTLGKIYLQIVQGAGQGLSFLAKNIGFLMKNVPFSSQKAEAHFNKAIEIAKEIEAKGIQSQAFLDLGLLHKARGRTDRAKEYVSEAIRLFEQGDAQMYLERAKELLASLG